MDIRILTILRRGNLLNNREKNARVWLFLSSFFFLIGIIFLSFAYAIYPMLVPSFGGGELFILASYNDFTDIFPWYSNSKLHLTIKANDSLQIYVDGKNLHNGTSYRITIEPRVHKLIMLKSRVPVEGRFNAYQESPWMIQLCAIGLFFTGLMATVFSSAYFVWLQKNIQSSQN